MNLHIKRRVSVIFLLLVIIVSNISCNQQRKDVADDEYSEVYVSYDSIHKGRGSVLDSVNIDTEESNKMKIETTADYCDKSTVKKKFLEYMDSYYPDWKIKGEMKIFEADRSDASLANMIGLCGYNIRFRAIDPHIKDSNIIVVNFQYNSTNYDSFSIKTVRGVLY